MLYIVMHLDSANYMYQLSPGVIPAMPHMHIHFQFLCFSHSKSFCPMLVVVSQTGIIITLLEIFSDKIQSRWYEDHSTIDIYCWKI